MNTKQLQTVTPLSERLANLEAVLAEHKALDVIKLDISKQSGGGLADYLLVMTATSPRHARALADAISHLCHTNGYDYLGVEGYQVGEWVLVDLNDIIVSIFLETTRALYRLEDLWKALPPREENANA